MGFWSARERPTLGLPLGVEPEGKRAGRHGGEARSRGGERGHERVLAERSIMNPPITDALSHLRRCSSRRAGTMLTTLSVERRGGAGMGRYRNHRLVTGG